MSDRVVHCPFLNRADSRCSNHFSLDRLGHAFEHCFDRYKTCPTYLELLVERRVRRAGESVLRQPGEPVDSSSADPSEPAHAGTRDPRDASPFVQLRIPTAAGATARPPVPDRYHRAVA